MFAERGKTGYHEGEKNRIKQKLKNLDHATCNDCGVKGHYKRSSEWSTQKYFKEDEVVLRNKKQVKSGNNPPGGGVGKKYVEDASYSLMMGIPTKQNRMILYILFSCFDIYHHKKSCKWNQ